MMKILTDFILKKLKEAAETNPELMSDPNLKMLLDATPQENVIKLAQDGSDQNNNKISEQIVSYAPVAHKLEKRKKYLHIALNNSLEEAENIINQLPTSDRILIEVGTPMIKQYGADAIRKIKGLVSIGTYIVADNKCADLADREVKTMAEAGANAATCLGVAPVETINSFIEECEKNNIDSMLDMMNVSDSISILKKLKKLPTVVILHRGVDETEITKGKQIPLYQIKQIKGNHNILVAVAGGDTIKEIQSALFNDADIVVVWKNFYQASGDTAKLASDFLKEIK
jgi:bifunctional enzyme Fae/Hps